MSKPAKPTTPAAATAEKPAHETFAAWFGEARWEHLKRQAATRCGLQSDDLHALCKRVLDTRRERYPHNAALAEAEAANTLLVCLNSRPGPEDEKRLREARSAAA